MAFEAPSSSGQGHRTLDPVTGVQISPGLPFLIISERLEKSRKEFLVTLSGNEWNGFYQILAFHLNYERSHLNWKPAH